MDGEGLRYVCPGAKSLQFLWALRFHVTLAWELSRSPRFGLRSVVFVFASAGTLVPFTFSARFAYGIWGFVCVFTFHHRLRSLGK